MPIEFGPARLRASSMFPYFSAVIWSLFPVKSPGIGTMAVDRFHRLYYDPDMKWSVEETTSVLIHEIGHLLRSHHDRADEISDCQDQVWNLSCFPAGTWLGNGHTIEDVATTQRQYDGGLVEITTQAGSVAATGEHPFLVRRRRQKTERTRTMLNDPEWLTASEIRVGDYVCVPKLKNTTYTQTIDLEPSVARCAGNLERQAFGNRAIKSIPLNEGTAWLIGMYVAKGSSSSDGGIVLDNTNMDAATRIQRIVESIGYSASVATNPTSQSTVVNMDAVVLNMWLRENCGSGAEEMRIPRQILNHGDARIRLAFLQGLIDGTGSTRKTWITIGTTSEKLALDTVILLAQNKIGVHRLLVGKCPHKIGNGFANKDLTLFRVTFSSNGASHSIRTMNGRAVKSPNARWKTDEHGVWYHVNEITTKPFSGVVYNLTTDDHTYIARGYLVHNCDAEINDDIYECPQLSGKWPLVPILPRHFNERDGNTAEYYYSVLLRDAQKPSRSGGNKSKQPQGRGSSAVGNHWNCGSGADGSKRDWDQGDPSPEHPGVNPMQSELIRREVAKDIFDYQNDPRKSRGTVPGTWVRWAEATLKPQVNWRRQFPEFIRQAAATISGRQDYSFQRPNRRSHDYGVILPTLRSPVLDISVIVDTSGSMSDKDLGQAVAEVGVLLRQYRNITVYSCDADIHNAQRVTGSPSNIKLVGGGGTDMALAINHVTKQRQHQVCVCITDGHTNWPDQEPRMPVIVAIINNPNADAPKWARVVHISN